MEQLVDPKSILRNAKPEQQTTLHDTTAAWQRLNQVELDPVDLQRHHIVTQQASEKSAPIDQLRSRLLHQMRSHRLRRLAVTAAHAGAGSSTLVANLALSIARQSDVRVMLFDFDLRSPSLIHKFGLVDIGPRYSALLHHRRNFDSACLRIGENLALSLNSTSAEDAAEVLASSKTSALLEHIDRDFAPDVILFDLPAIYPMDDAGAALAHADCALIIAQADKNKVSKIDHAERYVAERTDCLGVILNQCRFDGGLTHG